MFPPKPLDIFSPEGGCSEGLDAFRFFLKYLCVLDVRLVNAPAGVTQEEGHTGFLHLPSAVLAFIFIARRIYY